MGNDVWLAMRMTDGVTDIPFPVAGTAFPADDVLLTGPSRRRCTGNGSARGERVPRPGLEVHFPRGMSWEGEGMRRAGWGMCRAGYRTAFGRRGTRHAG